MMSIVHDLAEADVGDITPPHASGISREEKLDLEAVRPPSPSPAFLLANQWGNDCRRLW